MRVLIACEFSGVVREAFRKRDHDAWSCDLLPSHDDSAYHVQDNVITLLEEGIQGLPEEWDLIIFHPPCTYLTVAGNAHYANRPDLYEPAAAFATSLFKYSEKVCMENPIGRLSTLYRKPDQIIQPYEFGEDASKRTCLWLKGLSPLVKDVDKRKPGRIVEYPKGSGKMVERWSNQTDTGQNKLGPSSDRSNLRSITYQGIADAMAEQWS